VNEDAQHLQLLSIFHYVVGGLAGLFGCFPILHLAIGIAAVTGALDDGSGSPPPAAFGWIFILVAASMMAFMWAMAIAIIVAGWMLAARRAYTYCLVVAGVECMFMPVGTVLGVLTIIVLVRPSVKQLFGVPVNGKKPPHTGLAT
jgi:hypothetical protein